MVRREVVGFLNTEIRGLHQAAYLLAGFTLASQILALARDRLFASTFGAGDTLDVYYAAFRIPDTLYVLIASIVSVYVLIPFFEEAEERGRSATQELLSSLTTFFVFLMGVGALVGVVFARELCMVLYAPLMATHGDELVMLTRLLLLQPLLLGASNLFAAYVQTQGRFLVYAAAPILYNVGIIFGVLVLYPKMGTAGLAWGVIFGALLHLLVQAQYLVSVRLVPRIRLPAFGLVRRVVCISLPRTLALTSQQLLLLILVSFAGFFASGSIASLSLAFNLQSVPLAIIGASYSVAAFPTLARHFMRGETRQFREIVATASRHILFWSLPVLMLLVVLRAQIVRVIYGAGSFDWSDTIVTAGMLAAFVLSLASQGLSVLLTRVFYAMQRTWLPLGIAAASAAGAAVLAYSFLRAAQVGAPVVLQVMELLRVDTTAGGAAVVLVLSFSLGMVVQSLLLMVAYERVAHGYLRALVQPFTQSLMASLAAATATYLALQVLDDMVSLSTVGGVFVQGLAAGCTGLVVLVLVLTGLGNREISIAWDVALSRFGVGRSRDLRGTIES